MTVTKQHLLLAALTENITPKSTTFYDNCVQWLKSTFPDATEEAITKYAKSFKYAVERKWDQVRATRSNLVTRQSTKIKKYFSEPIVIGQDLATCEEPIKTCAQQAQQMAKQSPDNRSKACETCGNKPGDEVKKYLREMKRLGSSLANSDDDPLRISFEDKVLESFRSKSCDDAAFVFQKLLEDPSNVGSKVAAFLRGSS